MMELFQLGQVYCPGYAGIKLGGQKIRLCPKLARAHGGGGGGGWFDDDV